MVILSFLHFVPDTVISVSFCSVSIFYFSGSFIAHICEILGDKEGAVSAYREVLRLQREEWGIVSGEERDEVERAIQKLQE